MAFPEKRISRLRPFSDAARVERRLEAVREVEVSRAEAEFTRDRVAAIVAEIGVMVWEAETSEHRVFSFVSDNAETLFGYQRERWLEEGFWDEIVHPDDRELARSFLESAIRDTVANECEYRIRAADGRVVHVRDIIRAAATPLLTRCRGVIEDISARKISESELRRSHEQFALAAAATGIGLFELDLVTGGITASEQLERLYGLSPGGFGETHEKWLRWVHPDDVERVKKEIKRAIEERADAQDEFRIVRPDGEIRWMSVRRRAFCDDAGTPLRVIGASFDVTERKAVEEALRGSEARFRRLAENAPDIIFRARLRPEFVVEFASSAIKNMSGYAPEEFYADPGLLWRLIHPDDRDLLTERLRSPTVTGTVLRWRHRNGETIWSEARTVPVRDESGEIVALEGILRDITRQKRAEEERALLQREYLSAQRMEAVGRLAGGVAHNFNNLLTAITGYSELVLGGLPDDSDLRSDVLEIKLAAERAADVTKGLLAFSGRQPGEATSLDLNEIVLDVGKLLHQLIGEDIETDLVLAPNLASVNGDRSQLEQVVINLALNARDAMAQGGKLVIETANLDLEEPLVADGFSLDAGRYVTLAVSDTGHGMNEETRLKVFEPFFTTKGPELGTGLGLSSALGIVESAGGRVRVASKSGKGTKFTIYLPRSNGSLSG